MSVAQEAAGLAASPDAALAGAVVLAGGLALTPLAVLAARALVAERRVHFAPWRFPHFFAVVLVTLGATSVAGAALSREGLGLHELLVGQLATALGLSLSVTVIAGFALRLDPVGLAGLGLAPTGNLRAILAGLSAYLLCAPALLGTMLAWPWIYERLGGIWSQQAIVLQIAELDVLGIVTLVVLAALLQPLLEEIVFRSFVQPLFVQNLGERGGVVLTSVLFAALHGGSAFLPVFALSLLLGALMLRTQRLSAVTVVHALHNGLMLLLLFLAPELGGAPPSEAPSAGLLARYFLTP